MRASIQSRTRSRTPVSIGSIQSSKSRASGCPVGCTECDLLIRSVMAWSPTGPERSNARIPLCGLHHPETTPPSKVYHLPDGTLQRGWPDFLLVVPGGLLHALELKRRGETMAEEQESFA